MPQMLLRKAATTQRAYCI